MESKEISVKDRFEGIIPLYGDITQNHGKLDLMHRTFRLHVTMIQGVNRLLYF